VKLSGVCLCLSVRLSHRSHVALAGLLLIAGGKYRERRPPGAWRTAANASNVSRFQVTLEAEHTCYIIYVYNNIICNRHTLYLGIPVPEKLKRCRFQLGNGISRTICKQSVHDPVFIGRFQF